MSFFKRLKEKLIGGNEEREQLIDQPQTEQQQNEEAPQLEAPAAEIVTPVEDKIEVAEVVQEVQLDVVPVLNEEEKQQEIDVVEERNQVHRLQRFRIPEEVPQRAG